MFLVIVYMLEKKFACKSIVFLRNGKMFEAKKGYPHGQPFSVYKNIMLSSEQDYIFYSTAKIRGKKDSCNT